MGARGMDDDVMAVAKLFEDFAGIADQLPLQNLQRTVDRSESMSNFEGKKTTEEAAAHHKVHLTL